ncbi:helix-turn-helix domain-containing protein [Yinghuangia sp. YIM S09857]|uniref:helix-turn-helix domain-containing protein n=1 Tax=Yinghuangia sp. YIM S09857 TaxID=3436929 RepID=UPI003F52BB58
MAGRRRDVEPQRPSWILDFLGRQIRRYRELEGMTQTEAASEAHISNKHFSAIESGTKPPARDLVQVIDHAFNARGALVALRDEMNEPPGSEWFEHVLELEAGASSLRQYAVQVIPGLLQTGDYARAVLSTGLARRPQGWMEQKLEEHLNRQNIIQREDPPELSFILDECALIRRPQNRGLMTEQMEHLLKVGALPHVTIQVAPLDMGLHTMLDGPITIMGFDEGDECVYLEPFGQGFVAYDPVTRTDAERRFDRLKAAALSPTDTAEWIRATMETL